MDERTHQESKLVELILLLAQLSIDDAFFGDIKLNKLLYYSDFEAVRRLGEPITGVEYQKLEHGPAPRRLVPIRRDMERHRLVDVELRPRGQFMQKRTVPRRPANLTIFTSAEIEVVKAIIDRFDGVDAATISDVSHRESAGWIALEFGETIPYDSALVVPEVSEDRMVAVQGAAARHGW